MRLYTQPTEKRGLEKKASRKTPTRTPSYRSKDPGTLNKTRRPFNNVILPVTGTVGDSHVPGMRHAGACCHEGPRIAFSKSLAGQILRLVRVL